MSIELLAISEWSGSTKHDTLVRNPTWTQVESAIRALNNADLNDLYLCPRAVDSDTYLAVGGGAGRYILTGSINNESFPTLVDAARDPAPLVRLVVGGQLGEFPANWVVDLAAALEAAEAFFTAGGFHSGVRWTVV